ncbi:hypothetical protein BUALT_Bualt09G0010900 [Buddleja alternifolia]|uniref:Uncharacterized protein n=1 Tax=Buddleja alternifolia TaxID=168488 RepID=A0AAV6X670_9LAMI|nr:hypothetical protein BUALT_Bualt09G0010900 [Buddleja alternifolia]
MLYKDQKQEREMGLTFSKLFSWLFAKKEMHILMIGIDAPGKPIFMYKLKLREFIATIPTIDALLPEHTRSHVRVDRNDMDCVVEAMDELHRMLNEVNTFSNSFISRSTSHK